MAPTPAQHFLLLSFFDCLLYHLVSTLPVFPVFFLLPRTHTPNTLAHGRLRLPEMPPPNPHRSHFRSFPFVCSRGSPSASVNCFCPWLVWEPFPNVRGFLVVFPLVVSFFLIAIASFFFLPGATAFVSSREYQPVPPFIYDSLVRLFYPWSEDLPPPPDVFLEGHDPGLFMGFCPKETYPKLCRPPTKRPPSVVFPIRFLFRFSP